MRCNVNETTFAKNAKTTPDNVETSKENACWNTFKENSFLKEYIDWAVQKCVRRLFQARTPATDKSLSSNDNQFSALPVRVSADCRPLIRPTEDVSTTRSARYYGALPLEHRKTSVHSTVCIQYSILSAIGIQW